LLRSLLHAAPVLGIAAPEYASVLFVLFAAAASGPALFRVARGEPRRRTGTVLLAVGAVLAVAGLISVIPPLRPGLERAARAGIAALRARGHLRLSPDVYAARLSGYLAAARFTAFRRIVLPGVCWTIAAIGLRSRARRTPLLACAVIGELLAFGVGYLPSVRAHEFPADPPSIADLRRIDPGNDFLLIGTSDDYPANLATSAGRRDLRSYDNLTSRATVAALAPCGYEENGYSFSAALSAEQAACLAARGVRWVVTRIPAGARRVGGDASPGVGVYELAGARRPPPANSGSPSGVHLGAMISGTAALAAVGLALRARRDDEGA
jgi:hypothetical protein